MEEMRILYYETKSFLKDKEQLVEVYATFENDGDRIRSVPTLVLRTKNKAKVIPEVYEIIKEESEKRLGASLQNPNELLADLRESVQDRVDALFSAHPELLFVRE